MAFSFFRKIFIDKFLFGNMKRVFHISKKKLMGSGYGRCILYSIYMQNIAVVKNYYRKIW